MPVGGEVFPWHPRSWTLGEVLALPEDSGQRVELVDGMLAVSPAPRPRHQRVLNQLQVGLTAALPDGVELLPGINVVTSPTRLLIPDIAVVSRLDFDTLYVDAADVLLVLEVISPSSRAHDRVLKRQLYAEAGIEHYVLVDPTGTPTTVDVLRLDGDGYATVSENVPDVLRLSEPFAVEVGVGR